MLANREESADGHRDRKTRIRWIMGPCLAYQLADRGGRRVPVVQQNPVAIRKKALQYSAASHISPRTRQRGTGSPSPNVLRPTDYLISKGGKRMLTNLLHPTSLATRT